jgi:DNA-binding beta-propeller fold protein YncE
MNKRLVALCITAVLVGGCGGGAGPSSPPIEPASHAKVNVTFAVNAPASKTAQLRTRGARPQYLSPATQSITLAITGPTSVTETQNLTVNSSGCTSSLASTICLLTVALAPCTSPVTNCYTASLTSYDQTGGTGNVLSAAQSIAFTVVANQSNTIGLTLSGLPAQTVISPTTTLTAQNVGGGLDLYAQGAHGFDVYSVDADGDIIVGSGAPTFTVTTNSNSMAATIGGPTSSSPNTFAITPPATYSSGTVSITATPTFAGQATNGCAQTGANCAGVTITADMQELIYVTNFGGNTVTVYDRNGNEQSLGGSFSGLSEPNGIAFDPDDNLLYVVNTSNSTITAYDLTGDPHSLSGSFSGLGTPYNIAYDPNNGFLYITNHGGPSAVTAYDRNGAEQTLTGSFAGASMPWGIAYDPTGGTDGALYVANNGNGNLVGYDDEGNEKSSIAASGGVEYTAVAYNPGQSALDIFFSAGSPVLYIAGCCTGPTLGFAGLDTPTAVASDASNAFLYVTNSGNNTVTTYNYQGQTETVTGTFSGLDQPYGIAIVP